MIDLEFSEALEPGVYLSEKTNVFKQERLEKSVQLIIKDLPWIEKMDIVDSEQVVADKSLKTEDYESQFIEQAKRAVKIGVGMLEENNVLIKRPSDFYAEMLKSDEHMAKIKEVTIKSVKEEEMKLLIRQKREEKKFGKDVQREVLQQRQKEKTEFLKEIKKYRKDPNSVNLQSALEANPSKNSQRRSINHKREFKNKKYSMGGKRSGMKRNTKESANDMSSFNPAKHQNRQIKNKNTNNNNKRKPKNKKK